MAIELKQHIEIKSDNPLDARIQGKNTKAYIVAQFALAESAEAAAEQYEISVGAVYAALSFFSDNRKVILKNLEADYEELRIMGMRDSVDVMANIQKRMKD